MNTSLLFVITCSLFFSSSFVFAEDSQVDDVSLSIPISCTLTGTGMNSHTAVIPNGTINSAIGETTMKAYCNDNEGFAIYAIGYTDETYGKTVLTNSNLDSSNDITTGTATSGNTSKWAMKVATISSPTPSYPVTIENGFGSFHSVPSEYALVAKRTSATDTGQSAEGSTLKTTYQAFISPTQLAGTYNGKVKYTLVHPHMGPQPVYEGQVGVVFDGNGSTFPGGGAKNRVVYDLSPMYISTDPIIVKTSNISSDGTKNDSYSDSEEVLQTVPSNGADKLLVDLRYGITADTAGFDVLYGYWDGDWNTYDFVEKKSYHSETESLSGTDTLQYSGDAFSFYFASYGTPSYGYDYGLYAKVYQVYRSEHSNTEEASLEYGAVATLSTGSYATPTTWYGSWYAKIDGVNYTFLNENELKEFIEEKAMTLTGTSITLYRGLPFADAYANANKSQSGGYYTIQDLDNSLCNTVAIGQNATVIDVRDNNTYMIGRLRDKNCWMLENLRLDPTNSSTARKMNASNTSAPADAITNYINGGNPKGISGWTNVAVSNWRTSDNDIPYVISESVDTLVTAYGPAAVGGQGKRGVFYSYCAASAGTYCYENTEHLDIPGTLVDAPYSVCPINWRMPTGSIDGNNGELDSLVGRYDTMDATSSNSPQYDLSITLSGYYDAYYGSGGEDTYWDAWSSTDYGSWNNMYTLDADEYSIGGRGDTKRFEALSVRCILDH